MFPPKKIVVVDRRFCSWKKIHLTFIRSEDHLAVTDAKGKIVFKVQKDSIFPLMSKQVVVDGSGNPVISIQSKPHIPGWRVFSSDKSEPELLFTVKRCPVKTEFNVFLAANTKEEAVDFKIKGSYKDKTCTVYEGESSTVLARMSRQYKDVKSLISPEEEAFGMTVNRRIDRAFITALVAILDEIKKREKIPKKIVEAVGRGILIGLRLGWAVAQVVTN